MTVFDKLRRFVDWYASIGLDGLPESEQPKRYAFSIICLAGAVAAGGYGVFYALYDLEGLWPVAAMSMLGPVVVFLPELARLGIGLAISVGTALVILLFTLLSYHLGAASGLYLFMMVGIVAGLIVMGTDKLWLSLSLSAACVVAMLYCALVFVEPSGLVRVDATLQRIVFVSMIVINAVMIATGILVLTARIARAEAALAAEHARSESLLQNLLPADIARRLKNNPGEIIADGLPAVTLLFADIVDFTPRSARMAPEDLVSFLNQVFSAFDDLTEARGLEKIKTIGDAYMVAAGLPVAREDHAQVVADMALAMQDAAAQLAKESGEEVALRIGIHSGPAIAGVIGTRKVFYDVWGDTVNTASRMESHGLPGRVQITAATHALLGDSFETEPRGPVEIKGIGRMETWWLTGRRASA